MNKKYYGKYRAVVTDINDPEKRGRIRVSCPKVLNKVQSAWCEICSPVAYDLGGDFSLPKLNETVWIEFEQGDANKPIYVGGWWSTNKTPVEDYSKAKDTRVIEFNGSKITMSSDLLKLENNNSNIELSSTGVKINGTRIDLN